MNTAEYYLGKARVALAGNDVSYEKTKETPHAKKSFDLDMLYVECRCCGNPVLWADGKTSLLLHAADVETSQLDAECLILSDGCPVCRPGFSPYQLQVVRITPLTPKDILLLTAAKGNA